MKKATYIAPNIEIECIGMIIPLATSPFDDDRLYITFQGDDNGGGVAEANRQSLLFDNFDDIEE